jgi:hypothetical protein
MEQEPKFRAPEGQFARLFQAADPSQSEGGGRIFASFGAIRLRRAAMPVRTLERRRQNRARH